MRGMFMCDNSLPAPRSKVWNVYSRTCLKQYDCDRGLVLNERDYWIRQGHALGHFNLGTGCRYWITEVIELDSSVLDRFYCIVIRKHKFYYYPKHLVECGCNAIVNPYWLSSWFRKLTPVSPISVDYHLELRIVMISCFVRIKTTFSTSWYSEYKTVWKTPIGNQATCTNN